MNSEVKSKNRAGPSQRWMAVAFAAIAIGALVILSAGLARVEFTYGEPFSLKGNLQVGLGGLGLSPGGDFLVSLLLGLIAIIQLLLPVAIIYFLISPKARKQVLRSLLSLLWLVALYLLWRQRGNLSTEELPQFPENIPLSEGAPEPLELITSPPQWLVITLTIGLALVIAIIIVGVFRFLWQRSQQTKTPLEALGEEAKVAVDALHLGVDLKDTVLRCYLEMSRALREHHGLKRQEAMTPREFARQLLEAGLPSPEVRDLTRLFEDVRYGMKTPGDEEKRRAVACLTAIVAASKSAL